MAKKAYIGVGGVARKIKKGYVGVHTVPQAEYAVLAYIESTGTQYIDLNIVPTNHTFEIQYDSGAYNNDEKLFGTEAGYLYYAFTLYSNKYYWGLNGSQTSGGTWSAGKKTLLYNSGSNYGVIQDGVTLGSGSKIASNGQSLCLFKRVTTEGVFFQGLTYYCKLTEKSTNNVVRDCIPVKRLFDNAVGLYDKVEKKFYANAGTGVLIAGAETGEYIYDIPAEGSFARKIKKAYIGVGGVARPFWGEAEAWALYGSLPERSGSVGYECADSNGTYAIFFSGANAPQDCGAYDKSLTLHHPQSVPNVGIGNSGSSASVGSYVLLASGDAATVYGYDSDLTLVVPTARSISADFLCGASGGHHAIFGGGLVNWSTTQDAVNAYDADLVRTVTTLSITTNNFAGGGSRVGGYGFIAGGDHAYDDRSNHIDLFSSDMTRQTAYMSSPRHSIFAVSDGERALIAGGNNNSRNDVATVDTIDADLVRGNAPGLFSAKSGLTGGCMEGLYLILGGGSNVAEMYDRNLVHTQAESLPSEMSTVYSAACIGDYLVAGYNNSGVKTCAYVLN